MNYSDIIKATECGNCLLCHNSPCTKACPYGVPAAEVITSLRFENEIGAANKLPDTLPCATCKESPCMSACLRGKIDRPVAIKTLMEITSSQEKGNAKSVHLTTRFCGITCENPFFLSSSVVGSNYEMVAKAFEMGWAGVAFKTIGTFVPKEVSPRFDKLSKENNPFIGFKNIEQISDHTLQENLFYLKKLKENYPNKIIVASIMGQNEEEWTYLAGLMVKAGADIIECNFSCPHMSGEGLGSDVGTNSELVRMYTKAARKGTTLPILAKMTPNITNMEIPAKAAMEAGATGIAAINTIKSVMNVNLDTYATGPDVEGKSSIGGYSGKAVKPIALRFIHDMKTCDELRDIPISGMGGIETWKDAAEFLAMGCGNLQITTAVMQYGYRIIDDLVDGLSRYLSNAGYQSVDDIIGKALPNLIPAEELNRNSICYPKFDRSKCIGCGRCYLSCYDGGHQALCQNEETGQPIMDAKKCVGCHLCATVCPVGAITPGSRVKCEKNF